MIRLRTKDQHNIYTTATADVNSKHSVSNTNTTYEFKQSHPTTACTNPPITAKPKSNENLLDYYTFMNIQGLCPQTRPSKIPYLRDLLQEQKHI